VLAAGLICLGIAAATATAGTSTSAEPAQRLTAPALPQAYGDGTYVVGQDIKPGTYHANAGQGYCVWFTARDQSGTDLLDGAHTNGNGPLTVVVRSSMGSVVFEGNCRFYRV
jgi:hypothetical protein